VSKTSETTDRRGMTNGAKAMSIRFLPIPTETAAAYWTGGNDAYGMTPERQISDGDGVPCRHCLRLVAAGDPYLILAHRPFPALQPYAETGPIFLHAEPCHAHQPSEAMPPMLTSRDYIVRMRTFLTTRRACWRVRMSPTCTSAPPATTATSAASNAHEKARITPGPSFLILINQATLSTASGA
jgi:hypothetical protein